MKRQIASLASSAAHACVGAIAAMTVMTVMTESAGAAPPTFVLHTMIPFPAPLGPTKFALIDLDGDGALDLVCPGRNLDGRVFLLHGDGAGAFIDPVELIVGAQTDWVEVSDIDGDGTLDLVLAVRSNSGRVAIMRGLGGFSFLAPEFVDIGRDVRAVAVGEPGGDAQRPLFAITYGESVTRGLEPNGGSYVVGPRQIQNEWASSPAFAQWMGRADADGDGTPDLWLIATGSGFLNVMPGGNGAEFGASNDWRAPMVGMEQPGISNGSIVDLDGDGDLDIAVGGLTTGTSQSLVVFRNDGAGGFDERFSAPVTFNGYAWNMESGDLNLDGRPDLVMATALPGNLHVIENTTVGPELSFSVGQILEGGSFLRHLAIADLTGDCLPDIVAVDLISNAIYVYRNVTPDIGGCGGVAEASTTGERAGESALESAHATKVTPAKSLADTEALVARIALAHGDGASAVSRVLGEFGAALDHPPSALGSGDSEGGIAGGAPTCGPPAGPCNQVHAGPGCFTTSCCLAVCDFDPPCCTETWDALCVQYANALCHAPYCPSEGSCFEIHASRGCDDQSCCEIISRLDPFCGSTLWDEICVLEATRLCMSSPCQLDAPSVGVRDEDEPCYERWNQGCGAVGQGLVQWIELECADVVRGKCTSGSPRETDWLRIECTETTTVHLEIVTEFPHTVLLMDGACNGPLRVIAQSSAWNCAPSQLDETLQPGSYHLVIGMGSPERILTTGQPCDEIDPDAPPPNPEDPPFVPGHFGLHWQVQLTCAGTGIPGDLNGDGIVNGADLGLLLAAWGPNTFADLNGDGIVDGADLGILLASWTG